MCQVFFLVFVYIMIAIFNFFKYFLLLFMLYYKSL